MSNSKSMRKIQVLREHGTKTSIVSCQYLWRLGQFLTRRMRSWRCLRCSRTHLHLFFRAKNRLDPLVSYVPCFILAPTKRTATLDRTRLRSTFRTSRISTAYNDSSNSIIESQQRVGMKKGRSMKWWLRRRRVPF